MQIKSEICRVSKGILSFKIYVKMFNILPLKLKKLILKHGAQMRNYLKMLGLNSQKLWHISPEENRYNMSLIE